MKDISLDFAGIIHLCYSFVPMKYDRYLLIFRIYRGYRGQKGSRSGLRPKCNVVHEQPSLH